VGAFPDGQSALNLAAARLRLHGVVDQKISEHRVAEGPADERCHHRVTRVEALETDPAATQQEKIEQARGAIRDLASALKTVQGARLRRLADGDQL